MANVPSYNERMDTIRMVEEICKTKGAYATKRFVSFDQMANNILNRSKGIKSSLVNCIASIKNFISEYIKLAQIDLEVKTKLSLNWFKGYLNLVLKAAKHGVKLATSFVEKIMKQPITENDKGKKDQSAWDSIKSDAKKIYNFAPVKATSDFVSKSVDKIITPKNKKYSWIPIAVAETMVLGIVSAVIILGISWWLKYVLDKDDRLKTSPSIFRQVRGKWDDWFGNDEDDMANFESPDLEVPNISMTYVNEIQQSMFDFNLSATPKIGSVIRSIKQKYFSSMLPDEEYTDPDSDVLSVPDPSTSSSRNNSEAPWMNQYNGSVQKQSVQDPVSYTDANGNPIQNRPVQDPTFHTDANRNSIRNRQLQARMKRYGIPDPEDMPMIEMGLEQFDNPNLKESPAIVGAGLLFMLFLKAAIASSYNEEVVSRTMILKSAVPNSAALGLTTNALALGAGAAAFSK